MHDLKGWAGSDRRRAGRGTSFMSMIRRRASAALVVLCSALLAVSVSAHAEDLKPTEILNWGEGAGASLDPHTAASTSDTYTKLNLYDSLYRYESDPPQVVPSLATGYAVTPDNLKWTFTLRQGVKFHDGSELTADDVVYSFQRTLALKQAPAAPFWPILKAQNIVADSRYQVSFTLDTPYAPFLAALPLVGIVEKSLVSSHATGGDWAAQWLAVNDAGSGPYEAVPGSFRANDKVTLTWFPDYFQGWSPNPIKQVNVTTIAQESTMSLALIKGEIDATGTRISSDTIARLKKADGVHVLEEQGMRTFVLTFDNQRAPLNDVHVRKAISYAFDYDGYITKLRAGTVVRNPGPLPLNLWGNPEGFKGYSYDPAKAKEEIELAKKDGVDLSKPLTVYGFTGTQDTDLAMQLLQSNLRAIGITLQIKATLFPTLVSMASKESTMPDMWFHWVSANFIDPDNWIGQMYDSQYQGNWKASAFYKNDKIDQMLRQARVTADQNTRAKLYSDATQILMEDAPAVWISNAVEYRGVSDRVQGIEYTPVGSGAEFRTMHLTK